MVIIGDILFVHGAVLESNKGYEMMYFDDNHVKNVDNDDDANHGV